MDLSIHHQVRRSLQKIGDFSPEYSGSNGLAEKTTNSEKFA